MRTATPWDGGNAVTGANTMRAVLITGVPASGKSSFAVHLARRLRWTLLDLDTLTNPLYEHFGGEARAIAEHGDNGGRTGINTARYTCLYGTAQQNLAVGNDIILVAPFTRERSSPDLWQDALDQLELAPTQATLVWMDTPADEVTARMRSRSAARDIEKLRIIDRVLTPAALRAPETPHIRVDGMLAPTAQVRRFVEAYPLPTETGSDRSAADAVTLPG